MSKVITLTCFFLLGPVGSLVSGSSTEGKSSLPVTRIDFPYLFDPATLAVSVTGAGEVRKFGDYLVEGMDKYRRFGMRYSFDVLYPFDFHPDGIVRGDFGGAFNWLTHSGGVTGGFEGAAGEDVSITLGHPYRGSLLFNGGLEASEDSATEKWKIRNYLISIRAMQEIPGTDVDIIGRLLKADRVTGTIPITVRFSFDRIFENYPGDTAFFRANLTADWGFEVLANTYFYPHVEITQINDGGPQEYYLWEFAKYFSTLESKTSFVLFARYVSGHRPPDYIQVDDWEIGIRANFAGAPE